MPALHRVPKACAVMWLQHCTRQDEQGRTIYHLLRASACSGLLWQGYDVMEEMYNEKTAAVNFLHELCKVRAKGNLDAFMGLCIGVMNDYQVCSSWRTSKP